MGGAGGGSSDRSATCGQGRVGGEGDDLEREMRGEGDESYSAEVYRGQGDGKAISRHRKKRSQSGGARRASLRLLAGDSGG